MHREISEKIDAHHEGRSLMNGEELEKHNRRKEALEKKRRHLEDESSDNVSLGCKISGIFDLTVIVIIQQNSFII